MSEQTPEQKAAVANVFENIVVLLKKGLWFGDNAGMVAEAIGFLEANVKVMKAVEAAVPDTKKTKVRSVKGASA